MAEEHHVENSFFNKAEKPDTGSGFFRAYSPKPPSTAARVALAVGVLVVFIAVFLFTRNAEQAVVWVLNPGPELVRVMVAGQEHDVDPGRLVESRVPVEKDFQVGAFRGDKTDDITVDLKSELGAVSLVDLAADGAYVVVDVSSAYREQPGTSFPIVWESGPKRVHEVPYPATRLVRPGRAMPEKGSWELQVFQTSNGVEMFKVFRVDPKRLQDKAKLTESIAAAVTAKQTGEAESLRVIVTSTTGR